MKKSKFSVDQSGGFVDLTVNTITDECSNVGLVAEKGKITLRLQKSQVRHLITILEQEEKSTMPITSDCLLEVYVHDSNATCRVINVVNTGSGQHDQVFCENAKQLPDLISALSAAVKKK